MIGVSADQSRSSARADLPHHGKQQGICRLSVYTYKAKADNNGKLRRSDVLESILGARPSMLAAQPLSISFFFWFRVVQDVRGASRPTISGHVKDDFPNQQRTCLA